MTNKFIILCGRYRFFFFLIVLPWFRHIFSNKGRFGHKRKLPGFFYFLMWIFWLVQNPFRINSRRKDVPRIHLLILPDKKPFQTTLPPIQVSALRAFLGSTSPELRLAETVAVKAPVASRKGLRCGRRSRISVDSGHISFALKVVRPSGRSKKETAWQWDTHEFLKCFKCIHNKPG